MRKYCSLILICIFLSSCGGKGQEDETYISNDYLNVTPNVELLGDGQTVDLKILSNCSWTIEKDAQWLTVSPMSGNGNLDVSVSAGKNTSDEIRSSVLIIKGGEAIERKVTVTQLKGTPSEPEPKSDIVNETTMEDLYFHLRGTIGRRYMEALELSSDEFTAVSYNGNYYDNGNYARPSLHDYIPDDATISWISVIIDGIEKANNIIINTDNEEYIVMAKAMRAFFTFVMMENWGDSPIIDSSISGQMVVDFRQPRSTVARWIESELKSIIPLLPLESSGKNYGKPNRYMALALLAKLYINWPVYTCVSVESYESLYASNAKLNDCVSVCDEIISSGKFELGSDAYRFKFAPDNSERVERGTIKDFIYVMPYHAAESQGMQFARAHSYKDIKTLNPSYYGEKLSNSAGGYITMSPEFVKLFNLKGDERNKLILGLSENLDDYRWDTGNETENAIYIFNLTTLEPTSTVCKDKNGKNLKFTRNINMVTENDVKLDVGNNVEGWRQGCRTVKWFVIDRDYCIGHNLSNDIPIFRYADILLTKAEALTRKGSSSEAKDLVNRIRSYVGAEQLTGNPTLEQIYEERGREFFAENWRRNDMIRFGHFEDEFFPHYKDFPSANFDKTRRVFPIPQELLSKYPNWRQNNGY
jgi:hypothetical protein